MLIGFIIVPFLLPDFGPPLGGMGTALLALIASLIGGWVYFLFCEPERRSIVPAVGAFFFTAIAGVVFLLCLQQIAFWAASRPDGWGAGVVRILSLILSAVGQSYSRALSHDPVAENLSFLGTVLASITSVGLCEEITKLLPANNQDAPDRSQAGSTGESTLQSLR